MENVIYKEINNPYGFIYITTNLINGRKYLGQKKFHRNWKTYLGSGQAFKQAVQKYGEENFTKNIIYICYSPEELNQVEYDLSVFLDVVKSQEWYNLKYGGNTMAGYSPPLEVREKISKANKGKPAPNKGIPMPEAAKRKLSERYSGENAIWYGRHHTEESKKKIKQARIGSKASEETRKKMSKQRQGKNNYDAKPVVQLTMDGVFVCDWEYIRQASIELNISEAGICMCCKKQRKSAGGYKWIYSKEYYT